MPRLEARLEEEEERAPGLLGTAGRLDPLLPPAPFVAMQVGNTKEAVSSGVRVSRVCRHASIAAYGHCFQRIYNRLHHISISFFSAM